LFLYRTVFNYFCSVAEQSFRAGADDIAVKPFVDVGARKEG
jgi:hypothetical protein